MNWSHTGPNPPPGGIFGMSPRGVLRCVPSVLYCVLYFSLYCTVLYCTVLYWGTVYHVFFLRGKRRIPFRFPGFGEKRSIDRMRK